MRVPECINMRKLKMKIFEFKTNLCNLCTKWVIFALYRAISKETNTGLFEMSVMKWWKKETKTSTSSAEMLCDIAFKRNEFWKFCNVMLCNII